MVVVQVPSKHHILQAKISRFHRPAWNCEAAEWCYELPCGSMTDFVIQMLFQAYYLFCFSFKEG
jgi:hypothetical protein